MEKNLGEQLIEAGFTPFGDIQELTEDIIISNDFLNYITTINDISTKEKNILSTEKRLRALKCKTNFRKMLKEYEKNIKEQQKEQQRIQKDSENQTNFENCPYRILNCGQWIATDEGITKKSINSNGQPIIIEASPIPVTIIGVIVNKDTRKEKIKIAFKKYGKWQEIIVEKNTIVSKNRILQLANEGIEVNEDNAKNLITYFADLLKLNKFEPIKGTLHLGWENNEFVPYTNKFIFDNMEKYANLYNSVEQKGDYKEWKSYIKKLRARSKTIRFLMSAGFASPLVSIYNIDSFIVHLWGTSGKGKTIAQMISASIWGNPRKGKLLTSLNSTQVAMERTLNVLRNLPFYPDELQTLENTYHNKKDDMIYAITESKGKDRGTADGGLDENTEWKNISIFSGEEPITSDTSKEGTKNRVIEILDNNNIASKDGKEIASFIFKNHGFAGKEFIEIIQEMSKEELNGLQKKYAKELESEITYNKQLNYFSIILVADYISSTQIFNEEPLTIEDIRPYVRKDTDEADRIIEIILNIAESNINNFYDYTNNHEPSGQVWGELDRASDGNKGAIFNYNFIPNVLYEELQKRDIVWNSIKQKLADKSYIKRQKNGEFTIPMKSRCGQQRFIVVKNIHNKTDNTIVNE